MKSINYLSTAACFLVFLAISNLSFAGPEQMNATLARINQLLDRVNPLINLAQKQQDPNARVKFQFQALRNDIASIQSGIRQALQRVSIQPRTVKTLSGDYLPVSESVLKKGNSIKNEDPSS